MIIDLPFYINDRIYLISDPKDFTPKEYTVQSIRIEENIFQRKIIASAALTAPSDWNTHITECDMNKTAFTDESAAAEQMMRNHKIFPHFIGDILHVLSKQHGVCEGRIIHLRYRNNIADITVALLGTDDDDGYEIEAHFTSADLNKTIFETKESLRQFQKSKSDSTASI